MNREHDLIEILNKLLDWEATMGGFESPVWDEAKSLANQVNDDSWSTHVPE